MENEKRSVMMATKVTPSEAVKIDHAVKRTGHTLSSWLRLAALGAEKTGIVADVTTTDMQGENHNDGVH